MRAHGALLLVALALAACGDDGGGADAAVSSPTQPVVTAPPFPVPDQGDVNPDAPARRPVEATPGLLDPLATFVESYASVSDTKLELRFSMGVEDCYGLDHVDVEEDDESVTVTVFTGGKPGAGACIEIAELVSTSVTLGAPLGDRAVIDGSTGQPIPVD